MTKPSVPATRTLFTVFLMCASQSEGCLGLTPANRVVQGPRNTSRRHDGVAFVRVDHSGQPLMGDDAVVDDGEDAATFGCLKVAGQTVTIAIR